MRRTPWHLIRLPAHLRHLPSREPHDMHHADKLADCVLGGCTFLAGAFGLVDHAIAHFYTWGGAFLLALRLMQMGWNGWKWMRRRRRRGW